MYMFDSVYVSAWCSSIHALLLKHPCFVSRDGRTCGWELLHHQSCSDSLQVLRLIWWLWSRLTRKRLAVGQSSQATQAPAAAVPTSADTAGSRRDSPGEEAAGQETAVAGKAVSMHVQDHQGVAAVHL